LLYSSSACLSAKFGMTDSCRRRDALSLSLSLSHSLTRFLVTQAGNFAWVALERLLRLVHGRLQPEPEDVGVGAAEVVA